MSHIPAKPDQSSGLTTLRPSDQPGQLTVAVFAGAGSVHLYHALDSGYFDQAGLEVKLIEVCRLSTSELLASGARGIEAALARHGWPPAIARAAVPGLLGPAGLSTSPEVALPGLEVVADLRRRFDPAWRPSCSLGSLMGPGQGS
ncbi:hypothetical protein AB0H00_24230 [Nocardia sp. NPDC023852]|uniref:hypothetical protein n=1 Tax=Nocardia sp. NPDC023852 TaxID=3154697 RepID=UPI0033F45A0A